MATRLDVGADRIRGDDVMREARQRARRFGSRDFFAVDVENSKLLVVDRRDVGPLSERDRRSDRLVFAVVDAEAEEDGLLLRVDAQFRAFGVRISKEGAEWVGLFRLFERATKVPR